MASTAPAAEVTSQKANDAFPPLFPFVISHEAPDNATSMSHLLDAPAGKHGFVRAVDGHFATDAGPIKFNAVNLTGPANFPSQEDADRLADRLARFGINCVRLHYMDTAYGNFREEKERGIFGIGDALPNDRRATPGEIIPFDPESLNRLDYLIAALKKRGIYVNMNLHVRRFSQGLTFSDAVIASEKDYAKRLLTHVNPYTGLAYTDEPAVAMIEINNENPFIAFYSEWRGIFRYFANEDNKTVVSEFRHKWNAWLKRRYVSNEAIWKAWTGEPTDISGTQSEEAPLRSQLVGPDGAWEIVKPTDKVPLTIKRDFYRFVVDIDAAYWREMADYVSKELKAKAPVSGQVSHGWAFNIKDLDYVDTHAYWCHPKPVSREWRVSNASMVNSMEGILTLSGARVLGKPYTVSEYNQPLPNQFGAEGQPMLRAYGALQGWGGVFIYTWHHRQSYTPGWNSYFFSISERTDVLAHLPACAAMFLRGDVHEAKKTIAAAMDYNTGFERLVAGKGTGIDITDIGFNKFLGLVHKTGVDLSGAAGTDPASIDQGLTDAHVVVSDTGELTWNREVPDAGYFTVNTPATKLFTGFSKGRTIVLGDVSLKIGSTRLDWATVSLVSRFATGGFGMNGKPARILLAATGLTTNTGMELEHFDDNMVTARNDDWGRAPILTEGIPAEIELPAPASRTRCFALNPNGDRVKEVPVKASAGGSHIVIGPEYQTIWYEIEVGE